MKVGRTKGWWKGWREIRRKGKKGGKEEGLKKMKGRRKRGEKSGGGREKKKDPFSLDLAVVLTTAMCKLRSNFHMLSTQVLLATPLYRCTGDQLGSPALSELSPESL